MVKIPRNTKPVDYNAPCINVHGIADFSHAKPLKDIWYVSDIFFKKKISNLPYLKSF
jgi:hypothetical protein